MIDAVVFLPSTPLLLPGLTGQPIEDVEALRDVCREAIQGSVTAGDRVVVVGDAPHNGPIAEGVPPTASFRGEARAGLGRSVAFAVAAALLPPEIPATTFGVEASTLTPDCVRIGRELDTGSSATVLIAVGDGSARRRPGGPGGLEPDAFTIDDEVAHAVARADPAALLDLDAERCARLLVSGRGAWQVAAAAVRDRPMRCGPVYVADPYGVRYLVAAWRPAS